MNWQYNGTVRIKRTVFLVRLGFPRFNDNYDSRTVVWVALLLLSTTYAFTRLTRTPVRLEQVWSWLDNVCIHRTHKDVHTR